MRHKILGGHFENLSFRQVTEQDFKVNICFKKCNETMNERSILCKKMALINE